MDQVARLGGVVACLLAVSMPCQAQGNGLEKRLREEMPRQLRKSQEAVGDRRILTEADTGEKNPATKQVLTRDHFVIKANGVNYLVIKTCDLDGPTGSPGSRVHCRNRDYAFALERGKSGGEWLLTKLEPDNAPGEAARVVGLYAEGEKRSLTEVATFSTHRLYLPELFDTPGFKLTGVAVGAEPAWVRAEFEFDLSVDKHQDRVVSAVSFDTDRQWLPVEWVFRIVRNGQVIEERCTRKVVAWSDNEHHFSYVKTTSSVEAQGKRYERIIEGNVRESLDAPITDADFRLPAFGLPEPDWLIDRRTPAYVWWVAGGVGCLVVFFVARVVLARRQSD